MFYKVTLIEKNDNHKEMIVKADSKKAAAAMIPAAKAFLFPGEDAEKYDTRIGEFAVDEDGVKVACWKIEVFRNRYGKCNGGWTFGRVTIQIQAKDRKEADKKAREIVKSEYAGVECDVYVEELLIENLIKEAEMFVEDHIVEEYNMLKYGSVESDEFARVTGHPDFDIDEVNRVYAQDYYAALEFFLKKARVLEELPCEVDMTRISAAEYTALVDQLALLENSQAEADILNAAKEKYGKVVIE
jgi:hypothetical protein